MELLKFLFDPIFLGFLVVGITVLLLVANPPFMKKFRAVAIMIISLIVAGLFIHWSLGTLTAMVATADHFRFDPDFRWNCRTTQEAVEKLDPAKQAVVMKNEDKEVCSTLTGSITFSNREKTVDLDDPTLSYQQPAAYQAYSPSGYYGMGGQ